MNQQKFLAEFLGTATLVAIGCGSVAIAGFGSHGAVGILAIALTFGLVVVGLAYAVGPISGCHINPAVSLSLWAAGRFPLAEALRYCVAQMLGAAAGAGLLVLLILGQADAPDPVSLGQNGWGEGYLGGFTMVSAFIAEAFATFVLCLVVLGATRRDTGTPFAGLAIGLTITALLLGFINVSGASLNPARSFGPALFAGGTALKQLWLFLVAPIVGGLAAGFASKVMWRESLALEEVEANG